MCVRQRPIHRPMRVLCDGRPCWNVVPSAGVGPDDCDHDAEDGGEEKDGSEGRQGHDPLSLRTSPDADGAAGASAGPRCSAAPILKWAERERQVSIGRCTVAAFDSRGSIRTDSEYCSTGFLELDEW